MLPVFESALLRAKPRAQSSGRGVVATVNVSAFQAATA